jgi:hypothetical protein
MIFVAEVIARSFISVMVLGFAVLCMDNYPWQSKRLVSLKHIPLYGFVNFYIIWVALYHFIAVGYLVFELPAVLGAIAVFVLALFVVNLSLTKFIKDW